MANPIARRGYNAHDRDLYGRTMSTRPVVIVASHHTEKRAEAMVHGLLVGNAGGGGPIHESVSKLEVGELAQAHLVCCFHTYECIEIIHHDHCCLSLRLEGLNAAS